MMIENWNSGYTDWYFEETSQQLIYKICAWSIASWRWTSLFKVSMRWRAFRWSWNPCTAVAVNLSASHISLHVYCIIPSWILSAVVSQATVLSQFVLQLRVIDWYLVWAVYYNWSSFSDERCLFHDALVLYWTPWFVQSFRVGTSDWHRMRSQTC